MLRKIKQNVSGTLAVMLSLWTPIKKKKKAYAHNIISETQILPN